MDCWESGAAGEESPPFDFSEADPFASDFLPGLSIASVGRSFPFCMINAVTKITNERRAAIPYLVSRFHVKIADGLRWVKGSRNRRGVA